MPWSNYGDDVTCHGISKILLGEVIRRNMPVGAFTEKISLKEADRAYPGKRPKMGTGKHNPKYYLYVLPVLSLYVIFNLVPFLGTYFISLFDWTGVSFSDLKFIGLRNYTEALSDPIVQRALLNNLIVIANEVLVVVPLGLALALIIRWLQRRVASFFRSIFFLPIILPLMMVGIMWSLFLNPDFGPINAILRSVGLSFLAKPWLASATTALLSLLFVQTWWRAGFYMILFVAGLDTIPETLYEAARIDGATNTQVFARITLPLLTATLGIVCVIAIMDGFKIFVLPYVLTGGGPAHATEVLSTWAYFQAFGLNRLGYGSGVAGLLVTISFVASAFFALRAVK